jgi:hypothetical protein
LRKRKKDWFEKTIMKAKGYQEIIRSAEERHVIYTDKEVKMHVFGPKEMCESVNFSEFKLDEHPESRLLLEEAKKFYEDGFCIVSNAVPQEYLTKARSYINQQYSQWLNTSKRQDDWRMHFLLDLEDVFSKTVEHAPMLDLILNSNPLLARLEMLMGSKPNGIFYNQVAYRTPLINYSPSLLNYTPGAEYHIDGQSNSLGTRFPDPWTVLVGIALVDIENPEMGNFTVFPGWHTRRHWSDYPEEKKLKTLPDLGEPHRVCLKAGDVVLVHLLMPHRGGKNILSPPLPTTTTEEVDGEEQVDVSLENIPRGTREFSLFRLRARAIDYEDPTRSQRILGDPWAEHGSLLSFLESHGYSL